MHSKVILYLILNYKFMESHLLEIYFTSLQEFYLWAILSQYRPFCHIFPRDYKPLFYILNLI